MFKYLFVLIRFVEPCITANFIPATRCQTSVDVSLAWRRHLHLYPLFGKGKFLWAWHNTIQYNIYYLVLVYLKHFKLLSEPIAMASKSLEGNEVGSSSNADERMHQLSVAIQSLKKALSSAKALLNITRPRTGAIDEAVNHGTSSSITYIQLSMGLLPSLDPVQTKLFAPFRLLRSLSTPSPSAYPFSSQLSPSK